MSTSTEPRREKVLIVGPCLSQRGGIATVIRELMSSYKEIGYPVSFLPTTAPGKLKNLLSALRAWMKIIYVCVFSRPDVVHIHTASRVSFLRKSILATTCLFFRVPYIIHLHGAEFDQYYENELGALGRMVVKLLFSRARRVIALSNSWKEWIDNAITKENTSVVFNGVSGIENIGTQRESQTILFLGELCPRKGTDELISAMRIIQKQFPNAVLELGGNGNLEKYRQQSTELSNINFLGWLDETGRKAAMSRASVYCLPSWKEGLPMSILEAMSAGLPVVSTHIGGIPEAVEDNVTGLLVEPGNIEQLAFAIIFILSNKDTAMSMGEAGRIRHQELFSSLAMATGCISVYQSCIKPNKHH